MCCGSWKHHGTRRLFIQAARPSPRDLRRRIAGFDHVLVDERTESLRIIDILWAR
jgi:hypothetical protein